MRLIYPPWRPQCNRFFRRAGGGLSPNQPRCDGTGELLGSYAAATEQNTKHQTPSSREFPNLKHQIPKTDAGQTARRAVFDLGVWSLELLWSLEFGIWRLLPWQSLIVEKARIAVYVCREKSRSEHNRERRPTTFQRTRTA